MWKRPGCTLTIKDFDTLQRMLEEHQDQNEAMTLLLRDKLEAAHVVTSEEVPEHTVTLNSRITFQVGNGLPETRILSRDRMSGPVGYLLPITTMRGLALLGLAEGHTAAVSRSPSLIEILQVTAVRYQPERAEKMRKAEIARPALCVLPGGKSPDPAVASGLQPREDDNDPDPSAA